MWCDLTPWPGPAFEYTEGCKNRPLWLTGVQTKLWHVWTAYQFRKDKAGDFARVA